MIFCPPVTFGWIDQNIMLFICLCCLISIICNFMNPRSIIIFQNNTKVQCLLFFNCVPPWWSWSRGDIQTILNVSSHVIFNFQVLIYYSMMFILIPRSFLCIFFYQKKENKKYASRGDRCQDTASPNRASKCLGAWRVCFLITIIIYL